jgi:hypothetical protein
MKERMKERMKEWMKEERYSCSETNFAWSSQSFSTSLTLDTSDLSKVIWDDAWKDGRVMLRIRVRWGGGGGCRSYHQRGKIRRNKTKKMKTRQNENKTNKTKQNKTKQMQSYMK